MNTFYEDELKRHDDIPSELARVHTLKDKVQYACRMFGSAGESNQTSQSHLARKRPNAHIYQSEYDSDSSGNVSPNATNVKDLPGYTQPPMKRLKIDPVLLIRNDKENIRLDDSKSDRPKATPQKSSTTQIPTSSKHLQASASKVVITGDTLSNSFLDYKSILVQNINNAFDNSNVSLSEQLNDKMGNIVDSLQPTLDDIINNLGLDPYDADSMHSSSSTSKHEFGASESVSESRQLDTPVPNDGNRSGRYELRSQNKRTPALNTSTETKAKKSGKAEIISDEKVNILPEITVHSGSSPILVDSDSEGAVTTTSQQQQQQSQQTWVMFQDANGQCYVTNVAPSTTFPLDTQQSQQSTASYSFIDPSQIIIPTNQVNMKIVGGMEDSSNSNASNQCVIPIDLNQGGNSDDIHDRIIEVNTDEVNKEGSQAVPISQQPSEEMKEAVKKQCELFDQMKERNFSQLKQNEEQKIVTPKQLIRSNVPNSSKSLSTPRNKNPHVRVLDFNTPARQQRLTEIKEGKNESFANTSSRLINETPQNRSIASSMPSSAPPKVNSVVPSEKNATEKLAESSTAQPFVPVSEDTVVSAEGETPKLRKVNRKSVVRTISAHKEINHEENEKRLKRVAKTKKKICPEDGDSNGSDTVKNKEAAKATVSKEDALAEWQRIRSASHNPELFEQNLREQNSKKQEIEISTGRKKRRAKKTPVAKRKQAAKATNDDSTKSVNISMNSTLDPDVLNSTETNIEAQMLEDMLKSAKKATPMKQEIIPKSAKKKTPIGRLQIKLTPPPKNKALKRLKSKTNLTATQTSNDAKKDEPIASCSTMEKPAECGSQPKPDSDVHKPNETEPVKLGENSTDVVEVAQNLISMRDVILQQESQRKQAQQGEIQSDSVSMSQQTIEVAVAKANSEPVPVKFDSDLLKYVNQGNLSLSTLLETPYKDGMQIFPKTPGITSLLSTLNTP